MKRLKTSIAVAAFIVSVAACTNNNSDTHGVDSSSLTRDSSMSGGATTVTDTGYVGTDSTGMEPGGRDTSHGNAAGVGSAPANDTLHC